MKTLVSCCLVRVKGIFALTVTTHHVHVKCERLWLRSCPSNCVDTATDRKVTDLWRVMGRIIFEAINTGLRVITSRHDEAQTTQKAHRAVTLSRKTKTVSHDTGRFSHDPEIDANSMGRCTSASCALPLSLPVKTNPTFHYSCICVRLLWGIEFW